MRHPSPLPPSLAGGAFLYGEGLAAGASAGRLRRADLLAPYRGVRVDSEQITLEQRCLALQLRLPPTAFFSCVTAAQLTGIPLPFAQSAMTSLHVSVMAPAAATRTKGVTGHSVEAGAKDVRVLRGLRVSRPERTWCELGAELDLAALVVAGDWLVHWRHPVCSIEQLASALGDYAGRRGRQNLDRALQLLDARSESPQESMLRVILATAGISGFEVNYPIRVRGRSFRADLAFPRQRLIIEYQGDYHRDRAQWRRDMTKRSILATDQWFTMEVNADDLRDAAELSSRVRVMLRQRPSFD